MADSDSSSTYFAGLDIGGTTIKAMLATPEGAQFGELVEVRSHGDQGFRKTFEQLKVALGELCRNGGISEDQVAGVGLDVPAPCSKGVIWGQANLSEDWVGTNIQDEFSSEIGKPVLMTNDGNAAAYGEFCLRPGLESGLLLVAPGTGLGGGFVLPNGLGMFEGTNGLAMEVGAMSVPFRDAEGNLPPCAGKGDGSLEAWVSLMAIRRELGYKLKEEKYADHPLNSDDIPIAEKAFQLRDYAEKEDELALEIFGRQAFILGFGLGDQASELDPGLIVIGGGLAETGFRDWYMEKVKEGFRDRAPAFYVKSPIPPHEETTTFEWAIGGDAAAALGVAGLAARARHP